MEMKNNVNGLTTYNEWFISAIKSSKVDGEIQEKKLLQNCLNCYNQVKTVLNSTDIESYLKLEEFRLNSTILLLLACPSINELSEVATCNELMPLIKSIPSIDIDKMFVVLKGLKNNKYLRGVLPWLPSEVLAELLSTFINKYKTITPLTLAFSYEIFYSLIYSSQYDSMEKESVSLDMKNFLHYIKLNEVSTNSKNNLMAYYFMYVVGCIYVLLKYLNNKSIEEPYTFSLGLKFQVIRNNFEKSDALEYESSIKDNIQTLASILNTLVFSVTSEIWILWHEIKAPTFGILCPKQTEVDDSKSVGKSIQLQIAHTIFKIRQILNTINLSDDILDLTTNKELKIFLNQVAIDPDYDSDNDLSTLELIDVIKGADNVRKKKLLTILLNREDIFNVKECLECLRETTTIVPKSTAFMFLKKIIKLLKTDLNILEDWKYIVFELSSILSNEDVITILKEYLDFGRCDILKTTGFEADFTQIFNQLSNHSDRECNDSYLRLCLQSGIDVVKYSIDMVLALPGLAPVLASVLRTIGFICREKSPDGLTLSTKLLLEKLDKNLTSDLKKEFYIFLVHLLEIPTEEVNPLANYRTKDLLPVEVEEVFEKLICPRIKMGEQMDSDILDLLEILKTIVTLYPEVILESKFLLSSIISLLLFHNNCSNLNNVNISRNLKVRNSIEAIFYSLEKLILKDMESFREKSLLLKIHLSRYELHPRTMFLVSQIVSDSVSNGLISQSDSGTGKAILSGDSVVDKIFHCILMNTRHQEDYQLPICVRIEWIWSLYIILPDCDEAEWSSALFLTHSYLNTNIGETNLVTPTMKIFHEVLLLLCDSTANLSKENGRQISLSHCFKCFSNASMKFINEKLKRDGKQIFSLINIFTWWCKAQRVFDCSAEYPALLLNQIVTALSDLLSTKSVDGTINGCAHDSIKFTANGTTTSSKGKTTSSSEGESSSSCTSESMEDALSNLTLNGSDGNLDKKKKKNKRNKDSRGKMNNIEAKSVPKKEVDDALEELIKVFVSTVRPSDVKSAVAGKLKAICEL